MRSFLFLFLFLILCSSTFAQEGAVAPEFPKSIKWADSETAPKLSDLKGKSVIVVFFQSWCPICNEWANPFFSQLNNQYKNDPRVTVVALKTDGGSISNAKQYINKGGPKNGIIIGSDSSGSYYKEATGYDAKSLYHYMWVKPDGTIGRIGKAGTYYTNPKNKKKKDYYLASSKTVKTFVGGTKLIFDNNASFKGELKKAQNLAESGNIDLALKLSKRVNSPESKKFREVISDYIQSDVDKNIKTLNNKDAKNRFIAYKSLLMYGKRYGLSPFGLKAKEATNKAASEPWLKSENNAERSFKSILDKSRRVKSKSDAERVQSSVTKFIDQHQGTYYATIAEGMLSKD